MVNEAKGRLFRTKDGKYLLYIPKNLVEDSMFPFKVKPSVKVKISFKVNDSKLIVEKDDLLKSESKNARITVLKSLEQGPLDVFVLFEKSDVDFTQLAKELAILLEAGYIEKIERFFYLTDRGRQYLKLEKNRGS